jgi:UDP-N-acetylglucosamine--N-acetylmuramyl-(pentapeptide) pyrophosphoryl-undecaprenol N-acetylglucosamine transferase
LHTKFLDGRALSKVRLTGNPVRDAVSTWARQGYQAPGHEGPFSLLIFGGSQGARVFADTLPPALALLPGPLRDNLFVVQQCREEDLQRVEAAYRAANIRAHLATFLLTCRRKWPRRISSSVGPAPPLSPSSR